MSKHRIYQEGDSQQALWNAWSVATEEAKANPSRALSLCRQKIEEAIMWYEKSGGFIPPTGEAIATAAV